MATVQDIVTAAYRKIGVVSEDEEMSDAMLANGVDAFNRMVNGWALRGVNLRFTNKLATDLFPLAPAFEEGAIYVLAARISPDYMVPANFDSDDWFRTIQGAYTDIPEASMPNALIRMPSQYWRHGISVGQLEEVEKTLPFAGKMFVEESSVAGTYGWNRTGTFGSMTPDFPQVQFINANTSVGILRLKPVVGQIDGQAALVMDMLDYRAVTLAWDQAQEDYRVTDADAVAWIASQNVVRLEVRSV